MNLLINKFRTRWDYFAYIYAQKRWESGLYIAGLVFFIAAMFDIFFTQFNPSVSLLITLLSAIVAFFKLIGDSLGFKKYESYTIGQIVEFSTNTISKCESDIRNVKDLGKIGEYIRIPLTVNENEPRPDCVFMSHELNKYLWDLSHVLKLKHDKDKEKRLDGLIKEHWEDLSHYLKYKTRNSIKEKRFFYNESKLCMGSGFIMSDDKTTLTANYSLGTYFDTYLTNIIFGKNLICGLGDNSQREATSAFLAMKPYVNKQNENSAPIEKADTLRSFEHLLLNNEWGVSTIAITKDHQVFQMVQSTRADSSPMLIVPSGSGSCDYDDIQGDDFRETMTYAMQRELWEETGFKCPKHEKQQSVKAFGKTRLIGFFRWLNKTGKPEILGISYIDHNMHELNPNITEVQKEPVLQTPVRTICEFKEYLNDVKKKTMPPPRAKYKGVSVPLLASITALEELLKDDDIANEIAEFLKLK